MKIKLTSLPQWTEQQKKRGLDPLGMQNSGILLYQNLLPGISNVTLRMRYYGFYCWLIHLYAQRSGSTAAEDWRNWIRRGEALFALAAAHRGGEAALGVGGTEWATEALEADADPIDFRAAAGHEGRVYLAQTLGVFGGAYATQMEEAGFLQLGDEHAFYAPTPILGRDAAAAFEMAIGKDAAHVFARGVEEGIVSRASLEVLAPITPNAIPDGSAESKLYRDALFARRNDLRATAPKRRDTLLLILRIARDLERRPSVDDLRWALFDDVGANDALATQRQRWEAYQTQDLFQLAAAGFLRWSLDLLRPHPEGLYAGELLDLCVAPLESAFLGDTWRDHISAVAKRDINFKALAATLTRLRNQQVMEATHAIAAFELISALDARVSSRGNLEDEVAASFAFGDGFRSIASERRFFHDRAEQPIEATLRAFLLERILYRHASVALQKFRTQRDYTYLFEIEDGRFFWRAPYAPVFTTPRLAPSLTFLTDTGLLDANGLTAAGLKVLEGAQ